MVKRLIAVHVAFDARRVALSDSGPKKMKHTRQFWRSALDGEDVLVPIGGEGQRGLVAVPASHSIHPTSSDIVSANDDSTSLLEHTLSSAWDLLAASSDESQDQHVSPMTQLLSESSKTEWMFGFDVVMVKAP
jgi:hypothetical protein